MENPVTTVGGTTGTLSKFSHDFYVIRPGGLKVEHILV